MLKLMEGHEMGNPFYDDLDDAFRGVQVRVYRSIKQAVCS